MCMRWNTFVVGPFCSFELKTLQVEECGEVPSASEEVVDSPM